MLQTMHVNDDHIFVVFFSPVCVDCLWRYTNLMSVYSKLPYNYANVIISSCFDIIDQIHIASVCMRSHINATRVNVSLRFNMIWHLNVFWACELACCRPLCLNRHLLYMYVSTGNLVDSPTRRVREPFFDAETIFAKKNRKSASLPSPFNNIWPQLSFNNVHTFKKSMP